MGTFIIGLILFFAVHTLPMLGALRARIIGRTGAGLYLGLFSLVSAVGLVLIVIGFGELQFDGSANPALWTPPTWTRHIAFALMIVALILLAAAYVPSRIRDGVGHPMLAAIKVWALAHLITNGELASVILFGSFLAFAVIDRISVKRRAAAGISVRGPLGARSGGLGGDAAAVAIGLGLYAFLVFVGHAWLIGIPLIAQ